jgi:hypothetical protein
LPVVEEGVKVELQNLLVAAVAGVSVVRLQEK